MKYGIFILGITIVMVVGCGCTQSSAPVQPTATMTEKAQTSVLMTVTTTQVPQTTNSVSANTVRIINLAFDPPNITIKSGSIVRWVNGDTVPHRIQFDDEHFSPILLGASQSVSQKFVEPGVYPYISLTHPEMHGIVIVE
jgi:plastocyanin